MHSLTIFTAVIIIAVIVVVFNICNHFVEEIVQLNKIKNNAVIRVKYIQFGEYKDFISRPDLNMKTAIR